MRKVLTFLASSIGLFSAQTVAASDAYVVPDAATPWEFQGTINVSESGGPFPLTCQAYISFSGPNDRYYDYSSFDHTHVANLSATIQLSGFFGLCNMMVIAPIPAGNITYSGGSFTFHDVSLNHPSKTCDGDLTLVLDETASPPALTVSGTLYSIYGSNCILSGTVELSEPGSAEVRAPDDPDYEFH